MGLTIISYKIIQKNELRIAWDISYLLKKKLHQDFAKRTLSLNLVK